MDVGVGGFTTKMNFKKSEFFFRTILTHERMSTGRTGTVDGI